MKKALFTQIIIAIQFAFAYIFINSLSLSDAAEMSATKNEALVGYDKAFSAALLVLIIALGLVILGLFIYHRRVNLIQPSQASVAEQMARPIFDNVAVEEETAEEETVEEEIVEEVVEEEVIEEPAPHVHEFIDGVCECGEKDPNYVPPHVHEFVEGVCACGEKDPNYVPPHVHEFVDGVCECGEKDPNYVPPHVHEFVEGVCACGEKDPNYVPPHVHEFIDGVCACGEKDPDYVAPHVHKFVDGVCECGEQDPNYIPEAHKVMFAEVNPEESTLETKDMAELITESISVEEAKEKIEDEILEELVVKANDLAKYKKAKKEKNIVNIDNISEKFSNGEVVNLDSLKARNLLPKKCNYFKVLARGILDKKLTVEANDFSKDAIKMILLTGGNVVKVQ